MKPGAGAVRFYRVTELELVKNPKNGSLEPEQEPLEEIYKNDSQELGAGPFLEGAGAESREQVKKRAGSPTLITMIHTKYQQYPSKIFSL